jgi:hypothetical protein
MQGDPIPSPSGKQSRSPSGSDRTDGHGSHWVFDVFTEDDGGTEGDGWPSSKRARSSSRPSDAAENAPPPAVTVRDVQMSASAYGDRLPRGDPDRSVESRRLHEAVVAQGIGG